LIQKTDLVIWDEAPMQHKHVMETVDHTFRDLRSSDKPFGGLSVVFGGEFQQILPVLVKGVQGTGCGRLHAVRRSFTVLHLQQNLCLDTAVQEEADFARWQLDVGHGQHHTDEDCTITLPEHFMCRENNVDSLIDTIYPGITAPHHNLDSYFSECTILSGLNSDLDSLNEAIMQRFPRDIHTFHSADFIPNSEHTGDVNINTDGPVLLILNLERKRGFGDAAPDKFTGVT
jgi:hypothetical protein